MAQKEIEIILMRQLASYLSMPIFVVDPNGTLLFYNEPAEELLGVPFDEAGEMSLTKAAALFKPIDEDGRPLPLDELPLATALKTRRPTRKTFRIMGLDGISRKIDVISFPLQGQGNRFLGAASIFWDVNSK